MATKTKPRPSVSSALNNTTTPAGIAANDPEASPLDDAGSTFAAREAADRALAAEDLSGLSPTETGRRHLNGTGPAAQQAARARLEKEYRQLPTDVIHASPTNPRKNFDKASLEQMAHGMKLAGVLQPLIVRVRPGGEGFELLAGERRWRAAKIAGLELVPVRVVDVTDEEAVEIQARENFDREDLNPIERARQFQHLLEVLKITQEALATRYDLTQGEISNSIRLLRLPEVAQRLVISGEITVTEARDELVPFADVPGLIEKALKSKNRGNLEYEISRAAETLSRDMRDADYLTAPRLFKPTPEQRKQLDVRGCWNGDRAFNVELYDRLQAEARTKAETREAKRAKNETAGEKTETAAERKEKAKKRAEQFAARLDRWFTAWLQRQIAARLDKASDAILFRLLLHFAVNHNSGGQRARPDELKKSLQAIDISVVRDPWDFDSWKSLANVAPAKTRNLVVDVLMTWVQHDLERAQDFDDSDVHRFAKELGIDPKKEWQLDDSFLRIHSGDQLRKLMEEWVMAPAPQAATRAGIVNLINTHAAQKKPPCPRELLGLKSKRG